MHPSSRLLSAQARKPLIQFIGKRKWPSQPEEAHPHPFAPTEIKNAFSEFVKKIQSSGSTSGTSQSVSKPGVYEEFWDMPSRFWRPRVRELEEAEMEAITSGGASLAR